MDTEFRVHGDLCRSIHFCELDHAAVDAFGRQVAGLVVEPEAPPVVLDLPQVFRLVQQFLHADVRVAGILVDDAAAIERESPGGDQAQHCFAEHTASVRRVPRPADDHTILFPHRTDRRRGLHRYYRHRGKRP